MLWYQMLEQIYFNLWYYKLQKKHRLLTKCRKYRSNHTSSHCHEEFLIFDSFKLSLSLSIDGVSNENERNELRNQIHVLYIDILPSRMHLVVITTHYWLLQFISGHYHPLTAIQFGFQNWRALQIFKMLGPNYYIFLIIGTKFNEKKFKYDE